MNPSSARLALGLTLAWLVAPGLAAADDTVSGEKLAYTCHGCHGIPDYKNAFPVYSVPKLGGQHAAYLLVALKAYASQERPHPTMHAQASTLSADSMEAIARFMSGEELKPSGHAIGSAPKASQTCVACHGTDGIATVAEYPNLAGQHPDYLEHALRAYRSGQRKNAVMAGMASALTDEDIDELADYYGRQQPGLCSTKDIREVGKCAGH